MRCILRPFSRRTGLFAAVVALLSLPQAAAAAFILDAFYEPASPTATAYVFGPTPPTFPTIFQETAQTFTVEQSGTLAQIDVLLRVRGTPPGDLVLEIQETVAGAPGGSVLGSVSLTPVQVGNPTGLTYTSFLVSGLGIEVSAGQQLALVLISNDSMLGDDYGTRGDEINAYAGGEAFLRSQGAGSTWSAWNEGAIDFGFRTFLVPEPGSAALLALGLAGLAVGRRRA